MNFNYATECLARRLWDDAFHARIMRSVFGGATYECGDADILASAIEVHA